MNLLLYLVTDPVLSGERPLLPLIAAALEGGVTAVQLRDKETPPGELLPLGREIVRLGRERGAAVMVNDRADLALALDADGVHVGAGDLPPAEARRLLPRPKIVGVSAATPAEARAAEIAGADYLGAGPVFATATKPDAGAPIGLPGLAAIVAAVRIPVIGIGGIDAGNAASVIETGAAGIAVISALLTAEDPEGAARELRRRLEEARRPLDPLRGPREASR